MHDYDEFLTSLRRIVRAIEQQSKRLTRDSGLSMTQLLVLQAVAAGGEPSTSRIAKSVIASQATVSEIIDRLVATGLIERTRSSTDRRVVPIRLTDEGRHRLGDAPEPLPVGFLREFRKLEDWERQMLLIALKRIAQMMDTPEAEGLPPATAGNADTGAR